ncbi:hypothetical protein J2743_000966 [Methanobacterium petrolearium]|nr:hypothetical protein [Methanobacterium petrolearium]
MECLVIEFGNNIQTLEDLNLFLSSCKNKYGGRIVEIYLINH